MSFREALERNGKRADGVGEQRLSGHGEQQREIQEYGTPAEKHE